MVKKRTSTRSRKNTPKPFIIDDATPNDVLFPEGYGHGYDPLHKATSPVFLAAPPADMKLIDPSEWDARIEEQDAMGSSLEHIRNRSGPNGGMMPSLDQNGQGFCVTADTEVLTERGWVPYPDYNWSDPLATVSPLTHRLEFQAPFERHVYEYDGPMIYSTNRRVDFGVTPDHQMYVRKWDERRRTLSDSYSFVRAADIGWYAGLLHAPSGWLGTDLVEVEVPGDRRYDGDDFLALLGLIVSDGYAGGSQSTRNWVSFASFRAETLPAMRALAARIGFRESPSRPGVFVRYDAGALAEWVRQNCYTGLICGSRHKRVPDLVKCASVRQIKHFLHYFDDRTRDGSQFFSTSKRLTDDLQELFLRIGKRSHIGRRPAKDVPFAGNASGKICGGDSYVLTVGGADRLCLDKKKHIETDHYKGLVYCAAVPNHTLITRRNGSVLISSNCWMYSVTMTAMMVRAAAGQPYVRLSAHAGACKVKNFRDEGGWAGLGAKWVRENGQPPVDKWPEKSMSRQYDTPETWAEAAKYKITEDWVDLSKQVYDQNLTAKQIATCLLLNIPVAIDYDEWGHSICALRWVKIEAGSYGPRIINSWTDGWGEKGMATIQRGWTVDGAVATRVVPGS